MSCPHGGRDATPDDELADEELVAATELPPVPVEDAELIEAEDPPSLVLLLAVDAPPAPDEPALAIDAPPAPDELAVGAPPAELDVTFALVGPVEVSLLAALDDRECAPPAPPVLLVPQAEAKPASSTDIANGISRVFIVAPTFRLRANANCRPTPRAVQRSPSSSSRRWRSGAVTAHRSCTNRRGTLPRWLGGQRSAVGAQARE